MKIAFGDIELHSLASDHLEMVRNWRNSPHIVSNMDHKDHISEQAQIDWYDSIDMQANAYFIIMYASHPYGLIHLANIDFDKHLAESGLFIGVPSAIGSPIPIMASLALLEFAFGVLKLTSVFAKVARHNQKAIDYNKWLGFRYQKAISSQFDSYEVASNHYYKKRDHCLSLFKLTDNIIELTIRAGNPIDEEMVNKIKVNEHWTLTKS